MSEEIKQNGEIGKKLNSIQTVYIKLLDGRVGVFTGPAILNSNENIKIAEIKFGPPKGIKKVKLLK